MHATTVTGIEDGKFLNTAKTLRTFSTNDFKIEPICFFVAPNIFNQNTVLTAFCFNAHIANDAQQIFWCQKGEIKEQSLHEIS